MGLNFLGLGFSLGAEDKGLASAIKTTSSGLMDISKSVVGIGLASAKMVFKAPDFGPAKDLVKTLAGDVKTTTTALEAYGVAASKTTSAGLAGLNLTEKQFRKAQGLVSSVAFSMNTDVGGVTKSFVALQQAGVDVNSKGFKKMFGSFEDYQKFIEVSGTNTEAFAASLGVMEKQMGMSGDQINDSVKAVAAIGKKFNIGRESIAAMSDTVKILNENANKLPQNWGPDRMQKFLKGTAIVQGALTSVGLTADEAIAASKGLTSALLKGEEGMAGLYSGIAKDIPKGMDILTQNLGSLPDAFKMMQESPDQFMLKMGGMIDQVNSMNLKPEALDRFRLQMDQTFGPDIMAAFNKKGFGTIGPALKKAQDPIADQDKALQNLSKRYQDGRTHAERFALAQDRVQTELKKVHGVMSDTKYLAEYNRQSKNFIGDMKQLADKGGIVGKATSMLIDFKMRGVGGAIAAHGKWGFALSEGMKVMQPFMAYLPALKVAFMALMSPIGMVAAAVAGLFFVFRDLGKGENSVIRPMLDKLMAEAPVFLAKIWATMQEVFQTVWKVLSSVDWGKVMKTVGDALTKVFNVIFQVIDMIDWNKVGQVLGAILSKAAEVALIILRGAIKLGEKLLMWLDGIDWGAIGKKIGYFFAELGAIAIGAIIKVVQNLPEIMVKIFQHAVSLIVGVLDGIRDYLVKKFPEAAKPITFIFEMIKAAVKIVGGAFQLAWKIIGGILSGIWSILKGVFSVIGTIVSVVAGGLKAAFGLIKDAVMFVWDKIKAVGSAIGSVVSGIGGAIGKVTGLFSGIGGGISDFFSSTKKQAGQSTADMIAKQVEMNKKITEEAKKRNIELAKQGNERAMAEEGYVRTTEGQIMKSADTIYKYVQTVSGGIQKVFMDTAKMSKAIVGGEAFDYMNKMQDEIRATNEIAQHSAKSGSDEWNANMDAAIESASQAHQEYFKKFGVRWGIMYDRNEQLAAQYSVENSIMEKAKSVGVGYYAAMQANQTKLAEVAGADILRLEQLMQAGKITQDQFNKQNDEINARMAKDMVKLGETTEILAGNFTKVFEKYSGNAEQMAMFAERASYQMAAAFKANGDEILTHLPKAAEKSRDAMKSAFDELGDLQEREIRALIAGGQYTGKALEEQVRATQKKYSDFQKEYTDAQLKYNDNLIAGSETGFLEATKKIKAGQDSLLNAVKAKTAEAAGEIQKTFGVTGDAALESVNQIAAVDPKIFRKNMAVVKESFMGFLKEMDARGRALLDNTTKSFNTLWSTMDEGWKKNRKLMEDFGSGADKFMSAFWKMVVDKAAIATTQLVAMSKGIETSMKAMARSINLLDLLTSPDQITAWAASVVSALATAMRGGAVADSLLSSSYTKALAMAGEIQKATPDGASMTNPAQTSGASSAATTLLASINHPAWTDKKEYIPAKLEEININLLNALKAMGEVARGKAVTAPKAPQPKH